MKDFVQTDNVSCFVLMLLKMAVLFKEEGNSFRPWFLKNWFHVKENCGLKATAFIYEMFS